ncbi:unnamed protein product [Sphagnum tenellum]
MASNSWRFEGFLLGFDSDYCGVYIFAADNHLLGMRPACKQLYLLGHPPKPQSPLHQLDSNSMRLIYEGTKHKIFLVEEVTVLLKLYGRFSARHLSLAVLSYGASRLKNFRFLDSSRLSKNKSGMAVCQWMRLLRLMVSLSVSYHGFMYNDKKPT